MKMKEKLKDLIPDVRFNYDLTKIFNGMAVSVPERYVGRLHSIPGIMIVEPNGPVNLTMEDSVPLCWPCIYNDELKP